MMMVLVIKLMLWMKLVNQTNSSLTNLTDDFDDRLGEADFGYGYDEFDLFASVSAKVLPILTPSRNVLLLRPALIISDPEDEMSCYLCCRIIPSYLGNLLH